MKLNDGIVFFATEDARKKWEGKELPRQNKKSSCPSCEIEKIIKENKKDYIDKENNKE
jgi:hypothetical protein